MEESKNITSPLGNSPWAQSGFDFSVLVEYSKESRKALSESESEQVTWLAGLITERVHNDPSELPAFPDLAVRILRLMENPDPDLKKLIQIIRADAVISAQILRTANSVFYSRGNDVTTVQDAAIRLGLKAVANVAIAAATRTMLNSQERTCLDFFSSQWHRLSSYCMQCAAGSRWLSIRLRRGDPEQIFLGGLLHDIGKVVALRTAGKMIPDGDLSPCIPEAVIEEALEEAHVSLGQELATKWLLPCHATYVCSEHHASQPDGSPGNLGLHVVRIASCLYEVRTNPLHRESLEEELLWSTTTLGLDCDELTSIAQELKKMGAAATGL